MKSWLKRIRGALGMGLTWGLAGALLGFVMEIFDPNGQIADIWPAVFAYPGFFGGIAFSVVLAVAGRRRRFDELSMGQFAAWGALGGLVVGMVPLVMLTTGLASTSIPLWQIAAMVVGPCAVGGAVAASGTLALARLSEDRALLEASDDVADVGLSADETRELLGNGG